VVRKSLTGTIFLAIISVALVTCVKYPPYDISEDPVERRNDTTSLSLISLMKADSIKKTVQWLQSMGTRFALADNHKAVAVRIRDKFIKMGYTDSRLDSFWITKTWNSQEYSMYQYNVIAELRGSRYSDSVMIVGAHYDATVSSGDPFVSTPGADDNGSGVASIIEIARVMKKNNYHPLSCINFVAFGAEEIGLMGSYDYAGKTGYPGRLVKIMINNDMIAYAASSNTSTWKVNIVSYENSQDLRDRAKSLCIRYTGINYTNDNTYFNRSDSYPFFLRDCKTIFFISSDTYAYYHTLNDISTNCNFDFCTEVTRLSCALLVWSDTPEL
jgi:hypothetical protein